MSISKRAATKVSVREFGSTFGFLAIPGHRLVAHLAGSILAAHNGLRHHFQIERPDRLQNFQFFVAHGVGIKRSRRFHGNKRSELQNVALDHVAKGAGRFIESAATLDAKGFRSGDLDMVDVIAIPERLENAVAKSKNQQILHRVFAEIMIDPVNLLFFEDIQNNLVEFAWPKPGLGQRAFL